jgi:hypothetical protein
VYEGEYCFFRNGEHPQDLLWEGKTRVEHGHFKTFPAPDFSTMFKGECGKISIQADAGAYSFDCTNPSNRLADSGTNDLHAYAYIEYDTGIPCEKPCDDEPVLINEEIISEELGECQPIIVGDVQTGCIRYGTRVYRLTYQQCDTVWTKDVERQIREGCECEEETCEPLPEEGIIAEKQGNPWDECSYYGDFTPSCKTNADDVSASTVELQNCTGANGEADFYICKQATGMEVVYVYSETPCPNITPSGWSHRTGCVCAEVD